MTKNKPEDYFERIIYLRGIDIESSDAIQIVENNAVNVLALVRGTKLYRVELNLQEIEESTCTCPYREKGDLCKHIAAVFVRVTKSLSEEPFDNQSTQAIDKGKEIKNRLKEMDLDKLYDYVTTLILNHDTIERSFTSRYLFEEKGVEEMISEFEWIVDDALGYSGFINYYESSDFIDELLSYLEDVKKIFEGGNIIESVEIITRITVGFDDIPMDDSGGGTTMFYSSIIELAREIIDKENAAANNLLRKWIKTCRSDKNSWYLAECLSELDPLLFSEEELFDRRYKELEKIVYGNTLEHHWNYINDLIEFVGMKKLKGASGEEIDSLLQPYLDEKKVMIYYYENATTDAEVEKWLLKGTTLDKYERKYFIEELCRFYQRIERVSDYHQTLLRLVTTYCDLTYYLKYKSLFTPKDWFSLREAVIDHMYPLEREYLTQYDVYVEERMFLELYELLKRYPRLDKLKKYGDHLPNEYDERIIELYLMQLDLLALNAGPVSHYQEIVGWMKHIRTLPFGSDAMKNKEMEYRVRYKRRKNFMKELNKLM